MKFTLSLLLMFVLGSAGNFSNAETDFSSSYSDAKRRGGRIVKIVNAQKKSPVEFDIQVVRYGNNAPIQSGMTLRSGDRYHIKFTPFEDCYVYIYQFDSRKKLFDLIEMSGKFGNHVRANTAYTFPPAGQVIELDDTPGTETIHVVALKQPSYNLKNEYKRSVSEDGGKSMHEGLEVAKRGPRLV